MLQTLPSFRVRLDHPPSKHIGWARILHQLYVCVGGEHTDNSRGVNPFFLHFLDILELFFV